MTSQELATADDARFAALLAADVDDLLLLHADEFVYTHANGRRENRDSFVESIRSGRVVYLGVDLRERDVTAAADHGVVRSRVVMRLEIEGVVKRLDVAVLAVWRLVDRRWRLQEWASSPVSVSVEPVAEGVSEDVREAFARAGTAAIANILLGHGLRRTMLRGIVPLEIGQGVMVGPAYTLRFLPSREDVDSMASYAEPTNKHRRAIEECPSGAVLVIDARGCADASSMGDLMAMRLKKRGVEGAVTDGGFRDVAGIAGTGLPAFHRRPAGPATPIALHPAALNEPIGCGGVVVHPGDVVVGDRDGVVVVPVGLVHEVAGAALASAQYEQFAAREIGRGRSILDVLPKTEQSQREFERWVALGRPEMEVDA